MELKVWVDGIQRVVCGVTDISTCQDVVYALAHATGQTGRFTLIEKWRNSERLLAPHEQPLKNLMKWGEYANDVHFVMRRSQADTNKSFQQGTSQPTQNHKRQHDFLHNFSPNGSTSPNEKIPVNNKEIKKSLTFSCGHGSSGSVSSESSTPSKIELSQPPPPPPTSNAKNRDAKSRQDLPKGVVRGIPQKPRDSESPNSGSSRTDRPKHPPPYDEAVTRSSGRFTAPSHLSVVSPTSSSPDEGSPSSKRRHVANKNEQESNQLLNANPSVLVPSHGVKDSGDHREVSPNGQHEKDITLIQKTSLIEDMQCTKSKKGLLGRLEKQIGNDTKHLPVTTKHSDLIHNDESNHDSQYQDLLHLVTLQREKLGNQQSELTQYDSEIVYWERKLQEQEEKLRMLQEDMTRLDRTCHDQEGELVELDRRSFNEEVELGRQEERTLRSELTLSRSQLAKCETELLQCHQRIRLLLEETSEERRLQTLREEKETKELEEKERSLQEQLDALQQQLKEKSSELENQKCTTDQVKEELQNVDAKMSDKQREVEKLMEEIREANLFSLSLTPTEEAKIATEGGNFYNRPGSTRKIIGSPRQLETAVPTNKNPHGVWV